MEILEDERGRKRRKEDGRGWKEDGRGWKEDERGYKRMEEDAANVFVLFSYIGRKRFGLEGIVF